MKYYIATTLSRATAHAAVRVGMEKLGYEISYDWTVHGSVQSTSKERLREVATAELSAVAESEFVVVLLPGGTGTHLELGFALGTGKRIFLHTEDPTLFEIGPQTNAFYHHPDVHTLVCPLSEVASAVHATLRAEAALRF